jgi:predicted negative regulator of RcsB-dependent stress response
MGNKKTHSLWLTNVASFILLAVLAVTGLINWLILPKGYAAKGSFLITLRHFFTEIHEWTALAFLIVMAIHILLHWKYVKANLKRSSAPK